MTAAEYKRQGKGLAFFYEIHKTNFGLSFIAITSRGILELTFLSENQAIVELICLKNKFLKVDFEENQEATLIFIEQIFSEENYQNAKPLKSIVESNKFSNKGLGSSFENPIGLRKSRAT